MKANIVNKYAALRALDNPANEVEAEVIKKLREQNKY